MECRAIPRGSIVVANPGSIPEMPQIASAFARTGRLRTYVTPVAINQTTALFHVLPSRLRQLLRRRSLPPAILADHVRRAATTRELLFVALHKRPFPETVQLNLMLKRNESFDRALSRLLDPRDFAVVATNGAALHTLRRAKLLGICGVLNCPIAHHDFAATLMTEEAELEPEFAHTLQYHKFSSSFRARLQAEIDTADHVLVLSTFQKRTFLNAGVDREKILTVPLGVDLKLFAPPLKPRVEDKFRVLFVGQMTQRKGLSYLLDGFELASIPASELLLVGRSATSRPPWEHRRNVRHLPHVSRWQLPALYHQADVFVLPSLIEGFGLTALEAMASGLPVILSENTFGRDIVREGVDGFIVSIRDPQAIAERLRFLYERPAERHRMGLQARLRAEDFSWQAYETHIVSSFQKFCREDS
jgi:glycosyltransferase involved in cell wall biosynthesis